MEEYYGRLRKNMVKRQIAARGVKDPGVLEAMISIPRHLFIPEEMRDRAYEDSPLPIGDGQTISQPYMVAWMTELLEVEKGHRILEIGTGSGYQAAILCELGGEIFSIEKYAGLAQAAERRLRDLGYRNIRIKVGDGTMGWPEEAAFDRIIVTAGSPSVPQPLLEQLAEDGKMVIPVGASGMQMLDVIQRRGNEFETSEEGTCVFVPLVGKFGWRRRRML